MKIKNTYTIEVFDENDKLKQEVIEENIVTNAYSTIKNETLQNEIIVGVFSGVSDQNSNFEPAFGGMGGMILLEDAQTENVNYFVPQGQVMGYAGDSTSSTDPRRGQRDDSASGTVGSLPATGFKDVYDFAPGEATGTYDCIGKISKSGGNGELLTSYGVSNSLGTATGYNQAFNDDMNILIIADNGTGTKYKVDTTDGEQRFEKAIFDGNYETSALTITGYTNNRGLTFYDGSWWTVARHTVSGEDRVVELDEDFTILSEQDTTLTLTLTNHWSYSCGLLDDGVDILAVFINDIDTAADTVTFQFLNLTTGVLGSQVVTDNMTLSTVSASTINSYTTFRDSLGNENLISILNTGAGADDKYIVMLDNAKTVIEENISNSSGFIDGITSTTAITVPHGGYENLVRLSTLGTNANVFEMRFARALMTISNIATVTKGALDSMRVTIQVNYV